LQPGRIAVADRIVVSVEVRGVTTAREPDRIGFDADPFGFPLRLRTATKLGYKNPKWITAIEVTNRYPGGYWESLGLVRRRVTERFALSSQGGAMCAGVGFVCGSLKIAS
jgi:hypothetical protein